MEIESDLLRKKLREHLNNRADTVAGGVDNWDIYQRNVGVIEGLALAERELLDMVDAKRKQEGGDDE